MSLTRAGLENELVLKLRGMLVNRFWTMSVLVNGSNPDLNGPIRRAIRLLGYDTVDPLNVVDADLAPFTGIVVEKLLDVARLETLKSCLDQRIDVDVTTGLDTQRLSTLKAQILSEITYLEQRISEPYGAFLNPVAIGAMGRSNGIPNDPFAPCSTRSPESRWPYPSQ